MAAIIQTRDLGVDFGDGWVFTNVDITIDRGEFVTLVGASGAGKSTLLRIIAGLMDPDQGQVERRTGRDSSKLSSAMVFQEARLMPWRTVGDNVALGLEALTLPATEKRRRIRDSLALVGLKDMEVRWPWQLSGGQRQRVGIARALAVEPDLLLMDEPFGALDAITRRGLQDELRRIWRETSKSILFVTHDIDEAVYLGERVLLLGGQPARIAKEYAGRGNADDGRDSNELQQTVRDVRGGLSAMLDLGAGI